MFVSVSCVSPPLPRSPRGRAQLTGEAPGNAVVGRGTADNKPLTGFIAFFFKFDFNYYFFLHPSPNPRWLRGPSSRALPRAEPRLRVEADLVIPPPPPPLPAPPLQPSASPSSPDCSRRGMGRRMHACQIRLIFLPPLKKISPLLPCCFISVIPEES